MAQKFKNLELNLRPADILLIVPPFAHLTWPSIGVHVLQGIAQEEGFEAQVMYGNMQYAAMIGRLAYSELCNQPIDSFVGERVFRQAAYGLPPLGNIDGLLDPELPGPPPTVYIDQLSDAAGESHASAGLSLNRERLEDTQQEHFRCARPRRTDVLSAEPTGSPQGIGPGRMVR